MIEKRIEERQDPNHIMSYKMEVNSIYNMQIANQDFADHRLNLDIGQHRINSGELKSIVEAGLYPANNLFFMDCLTPAEKSFLIKELKIPRELITNRLQNQNISEEERNILEDHI